MATRLQDAKIRVVIETSDAQSQLDKLDERERTSEQKLDKLKERERISENEQRQVSSRGGDSTSSLSKIQPFVQGAAAAADLVVQSALPYIKSALKGLIWDVPDMILGPDSKAEWVKNMEVQAAQVRADIAALTSKVEAVIPTMNMTTSMLAGQIAAGGAPDLPAALELGKGIFTIQSKKIELRKKIESDQLDLIGRNIVNTLLEATKNGFNR